MVCESPPDKTPAPAPPARPSYEVTSPFRNFSHLGFCGTSESVFIFYCSFGVVGGGGGTGLGRRGLRGDKLVCCSWCLVC